MIYKYDSKFQPDLHITAALGLEKHHLIQKEACEANYTKFLLSMTRETNLGHWTGRLIGTTIVIYIPPQVLCIFLISFWKNITKQELSLYNVKCPQMSH